MFFKFLYQNVKQRKKLIHFTNSKNCRVNFIQYKVLSIKYIYYTHNTFNLNGIKQHYILRQPSDILFCWRNAISKHKLHFTHKCIQYLCIYMHRIYNYN